MNLNDTEDDIFDTRTTQDEEEERLSDETPIGCSTWKTIKLKAWDQDLP